MIFLPSYPCEMRWDWLWSIAPLSYPHPLSFTIRLSARKKWESVYLLRWHRGNFAYCANANASENSRTSGYPNIDSLKLSFAVFKTYIMFCLYVLVASKHSLSLRMPEFAKCWWFCWSCGMTIAGWLRNTPCSRSSKLFDEDVRWLQYTL